MVVKVQIFTMRQAVNASIFFGCILFAIGVSLSSTILQAVIGVAAIALIVRFLLLPSQGWVRIDADTIAWRTPRGGRKTGLPPAGSVAVTDIAAADMVKQTVTIRPLGAAKQMEMRGIRLTLRSGGSVLLPIRAAVTNVSAASPLRRLVDELRRQHPELATALAVPTM
ncbi:hypothetical protein [Streptomyces sp. NBC_00083]|uniref:hypothetical protein n=1 Tax=Streptomyces sp. NBC_00083 TaxID=2975647 RepID=UPI00225A2E18|nr:hypothetical protein [Streptomyces sp. NBC_00083]MCX5385624.1 hypothetical protein [Streptomyces sp. NBC_00083]